MGSLPYVVDDLQGVVQIFSDGSIRRNYEIIDFSAFPVKDDGSVVWKDYCYDPQHDLRLRLYKPQSTTTSAAKLPVIYFLHGGGFCVGSFAWPNVHNCCLRISAALHVIVVAPDYRLAPEHRLPVAMDDSLSSLKWLQEVAKNPKDGQAVTDLLGDDLSGCIDFDRFFIVGDSSGGNIAHHLAVRLGPGSPELAPIKIQGYVMFTPFFGGTKRTKSEAEGLPEKVINIDILDTFWRMSLPIGKTTDEPFANPFGPKSPSLELVNFDPMLIMVGENEIMKDRVKVYSEKLKELGKIVNYVEFEGKEHGFFTDEPYSDVSDKILDIIKNFMLEQSS